jgi:hypothetical protein
VAEQRTTNPSGVRVASDEHSPTVGPNGSTVLCRRRPHDLSATLWWPPNKPNKLSGRDLVPYFSRQSREDADAMPQQDGSIPVAEHPLERSAS